MTVEHQVRHVPVRILTTVGWLTATLVLPRLHGLVDWLQHGGPFLRLYHARFPSSDQAIPAFALQRNAVHLIVPYDPNQVLWPEPPAAQREDHHVACLTQVGVLHGRLTIQKNVRIADWLLHHAGFFALHGARLDVPGQKDPGRHEPIVIVNAEHVIGVTDEVPAAAQHEPSAVPHPPAQS